MVFAALSVPAIFPSARVASHRNGLFEMIDERALQCSRMLKTSWAQSIALSVKTSNDATKKGGDVFF
jgi:hypothetical protein